MGIRLYQEPELEKPDLIASWPGIGDIGIIAIDTLKNQGQAKEFGEIEPWDFFYPNKVTIEQGQLTSLEFPRSTFYYAKTEKGESTGPRQKKQISILKKQGTLLGARR